MEYGGYIGIMEKKMGTTISVSGFGVCSPLKGFGYFIMSPFSPYSTYFRGTIIMDR